MRDPANGRFATRDRMAVFVIAATVRLAYWALVTPHWVPRSDADQYVLLARSLVEGDGYSLTYPQVAMHATAFRPPLYAALLAPVVLVTDGLWCARLLSVLLGATVAVLTAVLACRVAGRAAALIAGLLVSVYPPLVANDTITLSEPLALVCLLLTVLCIDGGKWGWAGVATGALMLTRPNVYLVAAAVIALAARRAGWRTAARATAGMLVLVVPWVLRNQVQVGTARLVTSDGFTLAAVFAPMAQQEDRFVDPVFDPLYDGDEDLRASQSDEANWNDELLQRATQGITENPSYLIDNAADNVMLFFELRPADNEPAELLDGRNVDFRRATLPFFYFVTAFGLIGLWRHRWDSRALILGGFAVQFALLCILILAPPRLRAPFDLACCVGTALLVSERS